MNPPRYTDPLIDAIYAHVRHRGAHVIQCTGRWGADVWQLDDVRVSVEDEGYSHTILVNRKVGNVTWRINATTTVCQPTKIYKGTRTDLVTLARQLGVEVTPDMVADHTPRR